MSPPLFGGGQGRDPDHQQSDAEGFFGFSVLVVAGLLALVVWRAVIGR